MQCIPDQNNCLRSLLKCLSKVKQIVKFLPVFLLPACSPHYVVNEAGYIRPPKNFKFPKNKNAATQNKDNLIDTTLIYYLHNQNYYSNGDEQYKLGDRYIRFYGNGRFKIQGIKTFPKIEDVNDLNKGIVGHYKLEGRVVKLKIYADLNAGGIQLEYGLINESNDLITSQENPRTDFGIGWSEKGIRRKLGKGPFNPRFYQKLKLEGMVYQQPNW